MQLPPLRPIKTNPHGLSEVPFEMEEEDPEQNFDIPQSREEKPAAYPNGPICIYESGVFLYFEPTVEQALTYDVIINVASEVLNPFTTAASVSQKELDARRVDGPPPENVDFASLPERTKPSSFDAEGSSPTTPKATPVMGNILQTGTIVDGTALKQPEYIHMQWEHNTDIVPDLYKLVKMMDDRVQQGKRILVHCQCGVSRSASLIVAYGLYKNPGVSVQEAYDSVKKRSKWIGPNMNLIMQLQEFRNGLLKLNESRSHHNQPFGMNSQRRSAGLPTANSNGNNRHSSPFDRDVSFGSRTPQTAPLPPDNDLNIQRASTGNMMAVSPGPISAPQSSFFSPGFRRSWASSQPHFDLSPRSSPKTMPDVDPKGHVVPVLSITNNDRSAGQADVAPLEEPLQEPPETEQGAGLMPFSVPNFSRQFPLRTQSDSESITQDIQPASFLTAPKGFGDFGVLRSPAVPSFNLSALGPQRSTESQLRSPRATEFNIDPWPRGYDTDSQPSPSSVGGLAQHSPISPRSSEFIVPALNFDGASHPVPLRSPRTSFFSLAPVEITSQPSEPENRFSQQSELISPVMTEFPKDIFPPSSNALEAELVSPRATEFHMTPLAPSVADVDPFGLTSPRQFDFSSSPFEPIDLTSTRQVEPEPRRPSFQAFLPPSHLAQPEAVNGFTSLNGTAKAQSTVALPELPSTREVSRELEADGRIDSLSTSPESQVTVTVPQAPALILSESQPHIPVTPKTPQQLFLSTPSRQTVIRTRFSSPNMREQRQLHKLQTEIEAKLPQRLPQPTQSTDDLDALMSPRAEEFTRNPFHVDFLPLAVDTSPASSNETIKGTTDYNNWKEPPQWTPPKSVEDPRSPVQTGGSPIVRNIWDVL
jgi:tyrosine-protein phosphatase